MDIRLIQVPYDSGHRGIRTGRGPEYFVQQRVDQTLREQGRRVTVETIEAQHPFQTEIYTAFELCRQLVVRVRAAKEQGAFPLILAGNCNSSLGTIAGIEPLHTGIIWFDAHGDFNTPETTTSGFLDGMGLAIVTGHCWTTIGNTIPGFSAIPENQVLLAGVRQLDAGEEALLQQSQVLLVRGEQIREGGIGVSMAEALDALRSRVQRVYVHIDLDVFDSQQVGRANALAEPNGLSVRDMEEALSMIASQFVIDAAAFTSYDPTCDVDEGVFRAGKHLMEYIIQAVEKGKGTS